MIKTICFVRGALPDRQENQARLLHATGALLQQESAAIGGLHVNIVNSPPANLPYRPPSDPNAGKEPEYDAIIEIWSEEASPLAAARLKTRIGPAIRLFHAYAVTPTRIYDRQPFPRGMPSEGIKLIGRLMFHADMPDSAVKRSWGLHAGLAARVHTGSAIYIQNWVEAALGDNCPPTRGMPIMHFPTDNDFFERFVDCPRGMDEIIQDTSHFVAGGPRFYTTEHILRGSPSGLP